MPWAIVAAVVAVWLAVAGLVAARLPDPDAPLAGRCGLGAVVASPVTLILVAAVAAVGSWAT